MNKKFLAVITAAILPFCMHASIKEATQLSNEEIKTIMENGQTNTIVQFKAGETFPLNLFLNSSFFTLNIDEIHPSITLKKDIYVWMKEKNNPFFSFNGKEWRAFSEIFTGMINAGFGVNDNDRHFFSLGGEIVERTP